MSFLLDLNKFAKKTNLSLEKVVKKVVVDLFADFVFYTPVDTGFARAGWMIGVGSVPQGMPADGLGLWHAPQMDLSQSSDWVGGIVWIANNVPYIRKLEYGHSNKAPRGMVRISIKRVKLELRNSLL